MTHLASGLEFLLRPREFLGRRFLMQEMYQRYLQGDDWDLPRDKDPFWECPESTVSVGVVQVALQPLSHQLAVSETYPVLDCHGQKQGHLHVLIQPCDSDGAPKRQQVSDPNELIGKQLHLLIRILGARGIPDHFTKTHCRFKLFCEDEDETAEVASSNPDYNFEKTFFFNPVTEEFLDYIAKSVLTIEVCGTQVERVEEDKAQCGQERNQTGPSKNHMFYIQDAETVRQLEEAERKLLKDIQTALSGETPVYRELVPGPLFRRVGASCRHDPHPDISTVCVII